MANYVLFESASGYGLFEIKENEEIASVDDEVRFYLRRFGSHDFR
jgi:hypothetical protein